MKTIFKNHKCMHNGKYQCHTAASRTYHLPTLIPQLLHKSRYRNPVIIQTKNIAECSCGINVINKTNKGSKHIKGLKERYLQDKTQHQNKTNKGSKHIKGLKERYLQDKTQHQNKTNKQKNTTNREKGLGCKT